MAGLKAALAHAFALPRPGMPTPEETALLDRLAAAIHRRGLAGPALLALESLKPLEFLGGQALVALRPMAATALDPAEWDRLEGLLSRREALEALARRLEALSPPARSGTTSP